MGKIRIHKEDGNLNEEGNTIFSNCFDPEINTLLRDHAESVEELEVVGSLLMKRVADIVSQRITLKKAFQEKLDKMTNDQFFGYLKTKYGEKWKLQKVVPEEQRRINSMLQARTKQEQPVEPCTGHIWHDEYGQEAFVHDDFTYCPVHDSGK